MTQKTHRSLTAGSAIAAALVFAPFPLLAQDVIVPTIETAPAAPPPAMPAPAVASEPTMVSSPVVQETTPEPVAAPEPAAVAAPAANARSAPAPVRQAAPVRAPVRPAATAPQPAAPVAAPVAIDEPLPPVAPVAATPVDTTVAPATAETAPPTNDPARALLPILLAATVFAALAIWAFIAIGRRRRPYTAATTAVVERPVITPQPQPQPVSAQPVVAQPAAERVTPLASPRPAESLSHTGAAVALPRQLPASYAERDALLRRMVAAKPDRANPFRSPKARARRARLILGSLGRDFSQVEPRIDLSQYQANWPTLARNKSAAA